MPQLNNISTYDPNAPSSGKSKSVLGKDDFMKLMIQQLKYQDPLNPTESDEYAAQLAQFSSLEQMQNMNDKLDQSINANFQLSQSINNTMSTALIGKEVKLTGDSFSFDGQDSVKLAYNLPSDAKNVEIEIRDSSGTVVKTFTPDTNLAGDYKLDWDFQTDTGQRATYGDYTFTISGKNLNGTDLEAQIYNTGKVDALRFTQDGSVVVIGGQEYYLSQVYEIIEPES